MTITGWGVVVGVAAVAVLVLGTAYFVGIISDIVSGLGGMFP